MRFEPVAGAPPRAIPRGGGGAARGEPRPVPARPTRRRSTPARAVAWRAPGSARAASCRRGAGADLRRTPRGSRAPRRVGRARGEEADASPRGGAPRAPPRGAPSRRSAPPRVARRAAGGRASRGLLSGAARAERPRRAAREALERARRGPGVVDAIERPSRGGGTRARRPVARGHRDTRRGWTSRATAPPRAVLDVDDAGLRAAARDARRRLTGRDLESSASFAAPRPRARRERRAASSRRRPCAAVARDARSTPRPSADARGGGSRAGERAPDRGRGPERPPPRAGARRGTSGRARRGSARCSAGLGGRSRSAARVEALLDAGADARRGARAGAARLAARERPAPRLGARDRIRRRCPARSGPPGHGGPSLARVERASRHRCARRARLVRSRRSEAARGAHATRLDGSIADAHRPRPQHPGRRRAVARRRRARASSSTAKDRVAEPARDEPRASEAGGRGSGPLERPPTRAGRLLRASRARAARRGVRCFAARGGAVLDSRRRIDAGGRHLAAARRGGRRRAQQRLLGAPNLVRRRAGRRVRAAGCRA